MQPDNLPFRSADGLRCGVFYLFRDTSARRRMLRSVLDGEPIGLGGEQLFGFDRLRQAGLPVDCNLCRPRIHAWIDHVISRIDRHAIRRTSIGIGDWGGVAPGLRSMNRAAALLATSDTTGLPAVRLKSWKWLKTPLAYVSIGLPERMQAVAARCARRAEQHRRRFARHVDRLIAYGYAEVEWLRQWLGGTVDVRFIPFGVETRKWIPAPAGSTTMDVLSVGADGMRDFPLLVRYAADRPQTRCCLITSAAAAATLLPAPPNLEIRTDQPVDEVRRLMAEARIVVLPVKENTYSGATTTLLQAMAMGKAVAVSRVGAIREGYGFEDGNQLVWMAPGSLTGLAAAADRLLADPAACRRIGAAARRHVEQHLSWEHYVSRLRDCLNGIGTGTE